MATGSYLPIRPFSSQVYERGTLSLPEKASQTFKKGAVLIWSGGYVTEAGAQPATVSFIAAEDGHNGGSDGTYNCLCFPILDSDLYEITLKDALAENLKGVAMGLVKDNTTGAWYLDNSDVTDQFVVDDFRIVSTPQLGAVGDDKARVVGKFATAKIALN